MRLDDLTGGTSAAARLRASTTAFANMVDGITMKAAGNDLLAEMDNVEPGKPMDESVIRKVALKYKLTPDKMNYLATQLYESGAIQQKQRELKAKWEEDQRDQALVDATKTEENPMGKPLWEIKERKKKEIENEGMPATVAPPKSRRIQQDEDIIEQEWDEKTGKWVEIARGPKFKKSEPGSSSVGGSSGDVGAVLTPEARRMAGMEYAITGKLPAMGMRSIAARTEIMNEGAAILKEANVDPKDLPAIRSKYRALQGSLNNQQKLYNMMGSFTKNLSSQISRFDSMKDNLMNRIGVRALDVPIRKLRTMAKGSGEEAIVDAYMIEISNEIGKLSTGSSASIQELSIEAQKRWSKIHDPNLSINELTKVLKETQEMGSMRMDSALREKSETEGELKNILFKPKTRDTKPATAYLRKAANRDDAKSRVLKLKQAGWSREELSAIARDAGWD